MTTYVQKKHRMFMECGDAKPERRRSESRLKTYPSSTDIRNWCDIVEDRRQHILELVTKDIGKCFGKIIPVDVIIDALLAMANADIAKLKNCMKQLWNFIHGLPLTQEDLRKLQELTGKMEQVCVDTDEGASKDDKLAFAFRSAGIDDESDECVAKERHEKEQKEIEDLVGPTIKTKMHGPGKMVTRIKGIQPGFHVVGPTEDPSKPGKIATKASGPTKMTTLIKNAHLPTGEAAPEDDKRSKGVRMRSAGSSDSVEGEGTAILMGKVASGGDVSPDRMAATQALCQEQQAKIQELTKERDDLKTKLDACLKELDSFKKLQNVANPALPASCQQEIEALEAEIKIMRKGNPSPEEEAEIIKKEVEILKKYCTKLKEVESENEKLKVELGSRVAIKDSDYHMEASKMDTLKDKLKNLEDLTKERDMLANKVHMLEKQLMQYQDLPDDMDKLKNRSDMLDDVLKERDNMCKKVKKMKGLEEELQKFKKKAERVDELERELRNMCKGDRNSGIELRKTQSIAGSLEVELQNARLEKDAMQKRIDSMKKELDSQKAKATEAEMLRLERDRLQIKLNELGDIQGQYEEMMNKINLFDSIKAERDMYKQKYEEVLDMECRCEMLKAQADEAKTMSRERDHLQKQVQDLEACICEQENEIKNLVLQVDSLSKTRSEANSRVVNSMKEELSKKDRVIAASKEQLVQSQSLATRVKELEKLLHNAEHTLLQKDCHIKCLENELRCKTGSVDVSKRLNRTNLDSVEAMRRELEAAKAENKKLQAIANKMIAMSGDEHLKKMLKQSECAVKRVVQELGKQYKEWDHLKGNASSGDDCEKLREELQELQREKTKLEYTVKQMQGQAFTRCPEDCV